MSIFKYYVENGDDFKLKILLTTLSRYFFDYAMDVTGQVKSEANLFYASIVKICIKSFESTYNGLVQKQAGTKGKAFEKLIPMVEHSISPEYADNFKGMYELWQEAAYSDHPMDEERRTSMQKFVDETKAHITSNFTFKDKIRAALKYAL